MLLISDADIAYVRDNSDIEAIVSEVVSLKRAGSNLKGLCPFHDERSPSFNVNPGRNTFHCFGCSEGGDCIAFVQKTQGSTFVEAIVWLADRLGHPISYTEDPEQAQKRSHRTRLVAANTAAAQFWAEMLTTPDGAPAATLLQQRGFTAEDAATWGCGYAPNDWHTTHQHLTRIGFTDDELVDAGLAKRGESGLYDLFRGRLIFPISNTGGDIIGFGGRKLFDDPPGAAFPSPKYLNTAETTLYKKTNVLYGIDRARKHITGEETVTIVEGYTDVIACHKAGIRTAVATCGTAFGADHARLLNRMMGGTGRAIYLFDGDDAGQKAAIKSHDLDTEFAAATYAVVLPDGLDPCDLRLRDGDTGLADHLKDPEPLLAIVLRAAVEGVDFRRPETQVHALDEAAKILARITTAALLERYSGIIAGWTGMPRSTVNDAINSHRRTAVNRPAPTARPDDTQPDTHPGEPDTIDLPRPGDPYIAAEQATFRAALESKTARTLWARCMEPADYTHPLHRHLAADLDATTPDAERLRRAILITSSTASESERLAQIADYALTAVRRRLANMPDPATPGLTTEDQQRLLKVEQHLHTRLRQITEIAAELPESDTDDRF